MNARLAVLLLRGSLFANGFRLALTVACIALGVALAGAVHTIHTSALAEIDRAARALSGTADLEIRGPRSGFDEALFAAIARRPEVAAASPVVEVQAAIAGTDESLRVLGIDALRAVRLQPAFVADAAKTGAGEATGLLDARHAWLTPAAAARLRARGGDKLRLVAGTTVKEFEIAGILAGMQAGGEIAVMDIAAAQLHFARLGRLSRIDLRLRPGVDVAAFRAVLGKSLPAGVIVSSAASVSASAAAFTRAYRVNLDALALVALATGAFLVFSTLALQAARRRRELALLRALGMTRRGVSLLLALEGASIGAVASAAGTVLGIAASRALLEHAGGDLGAGYFAGRGGLFAVDAAELAFIALLGVAMSIAGALWIARAVGRMDVAEGLRDRSVDLPAAASPAAGRIAWLLVVLGIPLLFAPPILGLPLAGYAAIACWLAAAVAAVTPICRGILRGVAPTQAPIAALALAQVRQLPGHLAASVAGIVVSASLCVAMAIMVFSLRVSLEQWLEGVVGADLYVRSSAGDAGYFTLDEQRRLGALAAIARIEPARYDRVLLDPGSLPVSLVARPIDARILEGFQAVPPGVPAREETVAVWVSEAARDLQGWKTGDRIVLPLAGKATPLRVAGVIRDYARTWGAVMMPIEDYRALTGDSRATDIAVHLAPGATASDAERAIRIALPLAQGLVFEDAADLRRRSIAIFERSFAVTYALEAIAVAIGLAGVTSSFAALAWSRRREFGVLRFLGLKRGEVLRMLTLEGAATGALGALIGLVSGVAISFVLVHVVNRQSFHWSLEVHWPVAALAALMAAIVLLCAIGARASAALAVRREAVLAVKDDA
jgi:putative ABC transport system permease protein